MPEPTERTRNAILATLQRHGRLMPVDELAIAAALPLRETEAAAAWLGVHGHTALWNVYRAGASALVEMYGPKGCTKAPHGCRTVDLDLFDERELGRWDAARHEAAHVVMAKELGGHVVSVQLREQGAGEVRVALPEVAPGCPPLAAAATFAYAGVIVEQELLGRRARPEAIREDERQAAATGLDAPALRRARTRAGGFLRRRWPLVVATAVSLFEQDAAARSAAYAQTPIERLLTANPGTLAAKLFGNEPQPTGLAGAIFRD